MTISSRIYIKEAMKELGYRDSRSLYRWCKSNNVRIFNDLGSSKRYLLQYEFEYAKNKAGMEYLVQKHGKVALPEVLTAHMHFYAQLQSALDSPKMNKRIYAPSGKHEKSFLARLHKITTTL